MLKFDDSKYPPPPSEIAAYQVTDPTICRSECRISDLWVFGYLNLLSNLLCGGGATTLYFFRPLLLDYYEICSGSAIMVLLLCKLFNWKIKCTSKLNTRYFYIKPSLYLIFTNNLMLVNEMQGSFRWLRNGILTLEHW